MLFKVDILYCSKSKRKLFVTFLNIKCCQISQKKWQLSYGCTNRKVSKHRQPSQSYNNKLCNAHYRPQCSRIFRAENKFQVNVCKRVIKITTKQKKSSFYILDTYTPSPVSGRKTTTKVVTNDDWKLTQRTTPRVVPSVWLDSFPAAIHAAHGWKMWKIS